jgi:hypothetical protein
VTISGRVIGNVNALAKVSITKEADFNGEIHAKSISVEDGAFLKAFIDLDQEPKKKTVPFTKISDATPSKAHNEPPPLEEGKMFKILEGSEGNVLGVEISREYTKENVEEFKKAFESKIAEGHDRVNVLFKIDNLNLGKIHVNAFIDDSMYALKHLDQLRHIAVVGDSKLEKVLVELDNKLFGRKKKELIEKYFDVADINKAWEFVRS